MIFGRFALLFSALCCSSSAVAQLTAVDVQRIITQAVTRASQISPTSVIAVVNREGYVLGVWNARGGQPTPAEIATCVSKAGTAAFLSSDQNAFTSRTAGFIIQQHFPPGVQNTPTGPLVGVGLSNLFFSDVNRFKKTDMIPSSTSPGTRGSPIFGTSLDGSPGGMPLYKTGHLVGGVGVTGDGTPLPAIPGFRSENPFVFIPGYDKDEDVALAGQKGYNPSPDILASNVYINGISLEYTESTTSLPPSLLLRGNIVAGFPIQGSPAPFPYPVATFGGVQGQIRQPIISDPIPGTINGRSRLTAAEVASIINYAADRVRTTRAGIRLPIGSQMQVFITVVNFPNQDGITPTVLGTFRTGEATLFSWDVAVQKARTALAYSNNGNTLAMSTRTVGFLAQSHYPPGIDADRPGPFFGQQETFSGLLGTAPNVTPNPTFIPNAELRNGITIFPGGFPLYRNGQMIGAIGVSGDGVDQDDIVAASGTHDFLTPLAIGADETVFHGARLPYAKFPRDPNGTNGNHDAVVMASPRAITPLARPDFNGDRKADIVFQNSVTGQRAVWVMNGTARLGGAYLPTLSRLWNIVGTGDLNADGRPDIIFQNGSALAAWLMNGLTCRGAVSLPSLPTGWNVAGAADFNGDGKPDLLMQNDSTGQRAVWLMNGTARLGGAYLPTPSRLWNIVGTGDLNADGKIDIVFQNGSALAAWLMNGLTYRGALPLPSLPPDWKGVGAADFNGDGKPDLLLQNRSTGQSGVWFLNGTSHIGGVSLQTVPLQWDIRNH